MPTGKFLILAVLAVLILPGRFVYSSSDNTESLTITTYYPAPYGVYRNLKLNPTTTVPFGSALSEGVMYYNASDHKLKIWSCTDQPACTSLGWVNVTESVVAGLPLVNSVHTEGDCTTAGGTPVASDTGLKQCKFKVTGINCPSGWTQYNSYFASDPQTQTCYTQNSCNWATGICSCVQSGWGCTATGTFSAFAFGNNNPSQEVSCNCGHVCGTCNCIAKLAAYTYIGCY